MIQHMDLRRRQPHQIYSLPKVLNVTLNNITINGLSPAAQLNSLVYLDDSSAISSGLDDPTISSTHFGETSFSITMFDRPPVVVPFYDPDVSISSIVADESLRFPGAVVVAQSSASSTTSSSPSNAAVFATVLASPLSAGSPSSALPTEFVEHSTLAPSSDEQVTSVTLTGSSAPSAGTVPSPPSDSEPTSAQPSSSSSSAFRSTNTGCSPSICPSEYPSKHEGYHWNVLALAISLPLVVVFVLAACCLLWRLKSKRHFKGVEISKERPRWGKSLENNATSSRNSEINLDNQQTMLKDDLNLGEPGPALAFTLHGRRSESRDDFPKFEDTPTYSYGQNRSSWYDRNMDPFHSATSTNIGSEKSNSKVGIASTRSSTAESGLPLAVPKQPVREHEIPHDARKLPDGEVNRKSSTSVSSEATIHFDPHVRVAMTQAIRRHSLTPRVINIVAARGDSDHEAKHEDEPSTETTINHSPFRSRSMSPSKLLFGHTTFVNNTTRQDAEEMFRIQTALDTTKGRNDPSSLTITHAGDVIRYPVIPDRGRSLKRMAGTHFSLPHTAYPDLGKTMADVKKTIREQGGAAFASSKNLREVARRSGISAGGGSP